MAETQLQENTGTSARPVAESRAAAQASGSPNLLTPSAASPKAIVQPGLLQEMLGLFSHRKIISILVKRDIASRYKGSLLGKLWPLVHPMGQLLIYTFVFSVVLKIKFGASAGTSSFAVYFMTGLIAWSIFSESVSRAPTVILDNPNLVTKVVFPTEILPLNNVFSAFCTQALAFSVLLVASIFYLGGQVHPTLLLLPVLALPLLMFSSGVSWFLASLGVYVRDTRHMVSLALQAGMYATPILYPSSSVPEQYRWILIINPLSGIVDDFRRILLEGVMPLWSNYCLYTAISAAVCFFGLTFFLKTKKSFADVM